MVCDSSRFHEGKMWEIFLCSLELKSYLLIVAVQNLVSLNVGDKIEETIKLKSSC